MPLVEIRNVTKTYSKGEQKITPLRDVSLDVERGDFVSLMGASGSGKSTLLNLIAGIDRPTAGQIVVDGQDITRRFFNSAAKFFITAEAIASATGCGSG